MARKSIQPDTLFPSAEFGFAQVVAAEGKKLIFCAGQTAWDKDMKIVGEYDLGRQMEKSLENIQQALAACDATLQDVVRLTIYIVDYHPDQLDTIAGVLGKFFARDALPANTLLGIQSLALPEFLVEMEATAVVDN